MQRKDAYRLTAAAQRTMVGQLLAAAPPPDDGRFCWYRIADSSRFSDLARTVECTVFTSFFANTPAIMTDAYARYEEQSFFLLVVDRQEERAAGALRVITYAGSGLKTLNDIELEPLTTPVRKVTAHHHIRDLRACWDVGTVAVLKEYRGRANDHAVSTTLYGRLRSEAAASGIDHFVAILDHHAFSQLVDLFAVPFVPIVDTTPFTYLGSESSRAAYCHVPDVVSTMSAHLHALEPGVARQVRPYVARLAFGEDIPAVIRVD